MSILGQAGACVKKMRARPHARSGILSERDLDLAAVVAEPALCGNTAARRRAADPLVTDRTLPGLVHNWVTFLQDDIYSREYPAGK